MQGIKHLIECHCMLPQYKHRPEPVFHKFVTFSVIDNSDTVVPSYCQCNNCGIIHKIIDICKSEIITGKEDLKSLTTIDEIRLSLKEDLCNVLEMYNADLATWQQVEFIISNHLWNNQVILTADALENETQGKLLTFNKEGKAKIETFIRSDVVNKEK